MAVPLLPFPVEEVFLPGETLFLNQSNIYLFLHAAIRYVRGWSHVSVEEVFLPGKESTVESIVAASGFAGVLGDVCAGACTHRHVSSCHMCQRSRHSAR